MSAQAATTAAAVHKPDQATGGAGNHSTGSADASRNAVPATAVLGRALKQAVDQWLDWQCRMIAGVHGGAVYVPPDDKSAPLQLAGTWPQGNRESAVMRGFADQARKVGRSVLHKAGDDRDAAREVRDFIAYPLKVDGHLLGIVTLALEIRSDVQRQAVVQVVDWGAVWLQKTLQTLHRDRR